jgi:hypothetical protein
LANSLATGQSLPQGSVQTNSNLTTLNNPTYDIGYLLPTGPNPAQMLDGPNPNGVNQILRFPDDTPPYYFCLTVNDYSRASWVSVGKLNEVARIILPLPREMVDNFNIRYAIEPLGYAGAVGFDTLSGDFSNAAWQAAIGTALSGSSQLAQRVGAAGNAFTKGAQAALGAAGLAVNDFMTVMLKGPDYKRRDFIWRLAPKNAQETSDLRRIIQMINNAMAPSIWGYGSTFFQWPKIFKPSFVFNGIDMLLAMNTFGMKPSVITDFSINYTPNGVFAPFASTKGPGSVDIRIAFMELEYWLGNGQNGSVGGDFSDGMPGYSSTTNGSNSSQNLIQDIKNGTQGGTQTTNQTNLLTSPAAPGTF